MTDRDELTQRLHAHATDWLRSTPAGNLLALELTIDADTGTALYATIEEAKAHHPSNGAHLDADTTNGAAG